MYKKPKKQTTKNRTTSLQKTESMQRRVFEADLSRFKTNKEKPVEVARSIKSLVFEGKSNIQSEEAPTPMRKKFAINKISKTTITPRNGRSRSRKEESISASSVGSFIEQSQQKLYYIDSLIKSFKDKNPDDAFYSHFLQSAQSILYINNTPRLAEDDLLDKKVYLPPLPSSDTKTLIFDLDETLIHCNEDPTAPCDIRVPIKFTGGEVIEAGLSIRPYAKEALESLSKHFEIVIFTASHSCYANIVLNILDPEHKHITYRLFRDSCIRTKEGIYVKDLRVFANRSPSNMMLIDNAFYSYAYDLYNGVPILPYYDNKADTELKQLAEFLLSIKSVQNVKDTLRHFFLGDLYAKYASRPEILSQMIRKQRKRI